MKGRVIQSTGKWYVVQQEGQKSFTHCRMKGKFRLSKLRTTNPIATGDWVEYSLEEGLQTGIIHKIYDRHNYIIRQSPHRKHIRHIIAANIDQALLIVTFSQPRTSYGFIDRFLLTAEMYAIPTVLVFNKQDVYTPKEVAKYEEAVSIYEKLGYTCFLVSAHTGYGTEGLKACMKDKTSLLSGHSGVGKSTLLNYFDPDLHLATQEVSAWSGKGMHTTTSAEIHPLAFGGSIIDTPGIKEFGLVHIEPEEVGHYFVDIRAHMHACKFNDCIHLNIQEKHCAVKRALNKGAIAPSRYHNYDNIVQSIKAINYWER